MIIFKLNLEDIRNTGFCIQIQMVIGLPFWVQRPPSFLEPPLPLSPTIAGCGVKWQELCLWGGLPASPSWLFSCIKGRLLFLASLCLLSLHSLTGQTVPPHSLILACPFFLIVPTLPPPCMAAMGLVFKTSLWEIWASSLSQLAVVPRPVQS